MTVNLSLLGGAGWQFSDNNGSPLSGGLLYTYAAGTTTPQATYTSISGVTANTNPVVLDSAGRVVGEIWLTDAISYKFVLKTSAGVTIGTYDNVTGNSSGIYAAFAASSGSSLVGFIQSGTGAVATTVQTKLRESVSVKDFGAVADWNGTTGTDNSAAFTTAFNSGNAVYIPKGQYMISSTVTIQSQQGISIFGAGEDATQIAWNGSNDGVMFTIVGVRHSLFQDMQLTGNLKAGTQLQIIQPDLTYLYTNTGNTYRNLRLGNNFPSSVKPVIQIGSSTGTQVDVQNFYDCKLENATKLVTQDSSVTLSILFNGCHFQAYLATNTTTRAIDLIDGSNMYFIGCLFVGQATEAIIYVQKTYGLLSIVSCESEIIGSGSFLYAEDDTSVSGNTPSISISGSTLGFNGTAGINWIDYRRAGNLVITGSTINSSNAVFLNHAPSNVSAFIDDGNWYVNVSFTLGTFSRLSGFARSGVIRATATAGNTYGTGQPLSGVLETKRVNTVDNTLSRVTGIGSGGGSANVQQCVQTAIGISTVAASIALLEDGSLILVRGSDGAGNDFLDLVISTNSGTPTVITSKTLTGSPTARTYSTSSFQLFLAMASGTYSTNTSWFGLTAR